MPINAYEVFKQVRANIGESEESFWTDRELLMNINQAQSIVASKFVEGVGDWLVKSSVLTPSSSVVTLPDDCAKPVYLEEYSTGRPIGLNLSVRERRLTRPEGVTLWGGTLEAYLLKDSIEINQDSYTEQVELWYEQRVPDLHFGTGGSASGSNALEFESDLWPALTNDYYNLSYLRVYDGTGEGTRAQITDYVGSTRVATVSGTFGADSVYGTESVLPSEALSAITLHATVLSMAKPGAALDPKYFDYFLGQAKKAMDWLDYWVENRAVGTSRVRTTELE